MNDPTKMAGYELTQADPPMLDKTEERGGNTQQMNRGRGQQGRHKTGERERSIIIALPYNTVVQFIQ